MTDSAANTLGESDIIETILAGELVHGEQDQRAMSLFLEQLQEQMRQAGEAADRVAREQAFSLYREGKRFNTLRRQKAGITSFMSYLDSAGVPMTKTCKLLKTHMYEEPQLWKQVTFGFVLGFRKWLLLNNYAIETTNAYLGTVKLYVGLACSAHYIAADELVRIQQVKRVADRDAEQINEKRAKEQGGTRVGKKKAEPTFLTPGHMRLLFAHRPQTAQDWRDLLAVRLLCDMALRPGEAISRTIGDLDLATYTLSVYRKKNRVQQRLPLSRGTIIALTNYLPFLQQAWPVEQQALYPRLALLVRTRRNAELDLQEVRIPDQGPIIAWTTQALYDRIRQIGQRIGIPNLCPYDFRHTWARGVVKAGNDRVKATQFGGWRNDSKMLMRYYGDEEVVESVQLPWE